MTEPAPANVAQMNADHPHHDLALGDAASPWTYTAIVEVEVDFDAGFRIHPALQDTINVALFGRGPLVSQGTDCVRVLFGVEGGSVEEAQPDALKVMRWVLEQLGLTERALASVEIRSPASLLDERTPVLVGLNEAATILGVSRQRATQIAGQAPFPRPIQRLRATPVWLESDIRRFAQRRLAATAR